MAPPDERLAAESKKELSAIVWFDSSGVFGTYGMNEFILFVAVSPIQQQCCWNLFIFNSYSSQSHIAWSPNNSRI